MTDRLVWSVDDYGVNFGIETRKEYRDPYVEFTNKYTVHQHLNRGQIDNPNRTTHFTENFDNARQEGNKITVQTI